MFQKMKIEALKNNDQQIASRQEGNFPTENTRGNSKVPPYDGKSSRGIYYVLAIQRTCRYKWMERQGY